MVYFMVGFGLGLAVSVPILTLFWLGAHKAAEIKYKSQLLNAQVSIMNNRKKVDDSLAKLKAMHEDMTDEQEEAARKEIESGDFFKPRHR